MKVALISTEALKTPPTRYGGVESMVYDLCKGLVEKGVDVTLFACNGSSSPSGHLVEILEEGWGRTGQCEEFTKRIVGMKHDLKKFDVIHDNSHVKPCWKIHKRVLNTLHWEQNPRQCHNNNVVAISEQLANWARPRNKGRDIKVVYNGCDFSKYSFKKDKTDRFLFLSALTPAKGADVALSVAKDMNLKMDFAGLGGATSASIEQESKINPNIRYFGEVTEEQKISLYQNAKALIFPTGVHGNWKEPFGLCLSPDSPILTLYRGVQKIKDIKIGDKVLTHKGRFMRVNNIMKRKYNGDMIKITSHKLRIPILLTPEHRVLAIKTVLCTDKKGNATRYGTICGPGSCYYMANGRQYKWCIYVKGEEPYTKYRVEWIQAKYLEIGDLVSYPRVREEESDIKKIRILDYIDDDINITGDCYEDNSRQTDIFGEFVDTKIKITGYQVQLTNEIPAEVELTEDLMRLFGYYIAEGHVTGNRQIGFSFNINEIDYINDVEKLMKEIFGLDAEHIIEKHGVQAHNLRYSTRLLSNIFINMFSPREYITRKGKGSKSNVVRIPPEFLNLPLKKLAQLINGEWRGDGSYTLDKKNRKVGYQLKTTSETLANQLQYILSRFGILPSFRIDNSRAKHNENWRQQYILEIHGIDAQIFNKIIGDKDVNLENIGNIESKYIKGKNLYYTAIKGIDIIKYDGDVFNLEVERDNSYISSIIVHNCAIESMSTGTPVITWNSGAMPEVVAHNQTGFICNSIEDIKNAIRNIDSIKQEDCRKRVEENFTYQIMAKKYIKLYKKLIDGKHW